MRSCSTASTQEAWKLVFLVCLYAVTNQRLLLEEVEKEITEENEKKTEQIGFCSALRKTDPG